LHDRLLPDTGIPLKLRPLWICVGVFIMNAIGWLLLVAVLVLIVWQLGGCVATPPAAPGEKTPNLCVCVLASCDCRPVCDCPKVQ